MGSKTLADRKREEFIRRFLIGVAILAGTFVVLYFSWHLARVVLLFFAGILLALFLRAPTNLLVRHTRLSDSWAVAVVVFVLIAVLSLAGWLMALPIIEQVQELSRQLPRALQQLRTQAEAYPLGKTILTWINGVDLTTGAGNVVGKVGDVFSITTAAIGALFFLIFTGVYLAVRPGYYLKGCLRLFPMAKRERAREVMLEMGVRLRLWLWGQLTAMCMVGLLTWVALSLLGIPLAGILGILAGLLDFIPIVGPLFAAIPAVLLAFLQGPMHALYALCAFVSVQFIESHLIIPLVQRQASDVPPVITLAGMFAFSILFGFLGLLLATPLVVVLLVFITMVYVEDILEKKQ